MPKWYIDFELRFTFLNYIIERCNSSEFPVDRSNNRRAAFDFDEPMRNKISQAIPGIEIYDIGCMLWKPNTGFNWHKDRYADREFRRATINIMLNIPKDDNFCEFCDINPDSEILDNKIHNREIVNYKQFNLTLLKTTEWHRVVNNSDINRYIFTIGIKNPEYSFENIYQKFLDNKLFDKQFLIDQ